MSDPVADLETAADRLDELERDIDEVGEARIERAGEMYERAIGLLDRYVDSASGSGDFQAYLSFQDRFVGLVEGTDEDLPARDAFEAASDLMDKRRLSERDFERARELLAPVEDHVALLDDRAAAREAYRDARRSVKARLDALDDEIDDLERLERLGDADLDAPVEELADPIRRYNEAVRASFGEFRAETSARDLLAFVERTEAYPLVDFETPPSDLRTFVESNPAGEYPVPKLLEYADYSNSKLSHYVAEPHELKTRVSVNRTYLTRLGPDPLTVSWPPPSAATLRYRVRELVAVVGRFADDDTVAATRGLRNLTEREEYETLRTAAQAREQLTDEERGRLRDGDVPAALEDAREERERLRSVLDEYPAR